MIREFYGGRLLVEHAATRDERFAMAVEETIYAVHMNAT
jgi:hypothetical protein